MLKYYPWLNDFVIYLQWVTLIWIFIKKSKFNLAVVRHYPWLFFIAVITPHISLYCGRHFDTNYLIINVFLTINFGYFFWVLHHYIQEKLYKNIVLLLALLYVISLVYEIVVLDVDYLKLSQFWAYIVGAFTVLIGIIIYLTEQLSSKDIVKIQHQMLFWILVANFIYFSGFLLFKVGQKNFGQDELYFYIYNIRSLATLFMNVIIIIGLLWKEKAK